MANKSVYKIRTCLMCKTLAFSFLRGVCPNCGGTLK